MSNMKIGILTHFYQSLNYGGMLQSYALAHYLNRKGFPTEQINYLFSSEPFIKPAENVNRVVDTRRNSKVLNFLSRAYRSVKYRFIERPKEKYYAQYKKNIIPERARRFSIFQEMVPHSADVCDPETVSEIVKQYKCLVTGSDQVWNFAWFNPAFFLDFPGQNQRRIAYAASAGKSSFCDLEEEYIKRTLSVFDAISVREADLVNILNYMLDISVVEQTVDPTLLLTSKEWDEIVSPRLVPDRYLFCYFLHNDENLSELARQFAREHRLKIAAIPFPGIEYNRADVHFGKYRFDEANPSDFLSLIKYAEFVMTDSFHATVFSLLYEKEFVTFPRSDAEGMGTRLSTLTEMFGCEERYCCVDPEERMTYLHHLSPIHLDWKRFDIAREKSEAFLARSLHKS